MTTPAAAAPILELQDATVLRGDARALDRVSLVVRDGEHTAIVGPNGAGKSSLIRLLTLQDYPLAGHGANAPIRWFGNDRWVLSELHARLGVVSGDFETAFGAVSRQGRIEGLEAVASGFFASQGLHAHHHVSPRLMDEAREALARVDGLALAAKRLDQMSAGERRRVLIARALVNRPRALLLDEPCAGLDFVARHRFMASVRRLAHDGTTIVLVTHHIEEIIPEIAQVVLLQNGRVAARGAPAAVLTSACLTRIYGAPVAVERDTGGFRVRVDAASPVAAPPIEV